MAKRLFIDLTKCDKCAECKVKCAYHYRPHETDHGLLSLRELVAFTLVCRRCEEAACVAGCRFGALERQEDGRLQRYNLLCVSCKCCSHACPFGTIYPETLPFYVSICDFCIKNKEEPPCVISCPHGALEYREVEENPQEGIFLIGGHLAAKAPKWEKSNV